jgi:phosphate:Na+ symporter
LGVLVRVLAVAPAAPLRIVAVVVAVVAAAGSVRAAPPVALAVEPPFPGARFHVGEVGDTLAFRVAATRDPGVPVPAVRVVVHAPTGEQGRTRPVAVSAEATTGADGFAELSIRLPEAPGEHVLLVESPRPGASPTAFRVHVLRRHWGRFALMGACGGLAVFLYGMRLLGRGLEKMVGGRLRESLASMTSSRLRSVVFGMVSTFLVQSSGASTALLVSFASAGLVTVRSCLGATLGAAVGSSFTVQLIAFRVADWALLVVAIGFLMTTARGRARRIGGIVLGFGLLFFGLMIMSESMSPLQGLPSVHRFLAATRDDPLPALVAGAVFTALVHTSAATLGILLSLAFQGLITLDAALPVIFGANVGTATTGLLAALGGNADGRRVAWAHAAFRVVGVLAFLPFLGPFADAVRALPGDAARQIANAHTLLSIVTAALLLPFIPVADRLFRALIPDDRPRADEDRPLALDPRFHEQPTLAIAGALQEVLRMAHVVEGMLADVGRALQHDDPALATAIRERDDRVDRFDEEITPYLTELSGEILSKEQSGRVVGLFFVTKDLELIADTVSKGLVPGLLKKKHELGVRFSDEGFRQLVDYHDRVTRCLTLAVAAVATWDPAVAQQVVATKRELAAQERRLHLDHLERLRGGNEETRATTTLHIDAVSDLTRIVRHAARIAYAVLGRVQDDATEPRNGA